MSYLLTKLLPIFVYPLGLAIMLALLGLLLWTAKLKKSAFLSVLLSVIILWAASTTVVAERISASLEHQYPPLKVETMPLADAIVILGGVTRGIVPGTGKTDLDGGVDRLIHGARLFKAGKAPVIILSGGNADGYQPEAEAMAEILSFMGIPRQNMLLETASRNTWQNGLNTKRIVEERGMNTILLVTSAYHLRRAQAVFEAMGMSVIPAATDYQLVERYTSVLDWLPQASSLNMTTKAIKEYIGWWVYSFKLADGSYGSSHMN